MLDKGHLPHFKSQRHPRLQFLRRAGGPLQVADAHAAIPQWSAVVNFT